MKTIDYNFMASYADSENILSTLINQVQHYHKIENVSFYICTNKDIDSETPYTAEKQNFLFVVGDNDFSLSIDGKLFTVREMVLVQKANKFNFTISKTSDSTCSLNIHVLHGTI